jgi:NAD(P)-dependent dehydrogenase (short-subunit alcohol dehydrogenase family)
MRFAGKTVVITGAGSGVGRGLAVGFCSDGADVVGIGRTEADLARTAELCAGRMHWIAGDVARETDVERLFAEAHARHGKVDILVNNAALYPKQRFLETPQREWAYAIETNLIGLAHCCRLALPGMLERGHGRILNMGSFAWLRPIPASSAYAASKAAVRTFTRALASEIDRQRFPDVLVNELLAGVYRTRMSEVGEDPADAYRHASFVAALPAGGPHGESFLGSELYVEETGLRARVRRAIGRILGRGARR